MTARAGLALLALVIGCTKSEPELREDDRRAIELIVAEDVRASKAMGEADQAARKGDNTAAIDVVETRAKPAIEAGRRAAANAHPKTAWGEASRGTLAKILDDRAAEVGPYVEALRGGELDKLVNAMEAQAKIERRAIEAVAAVREGR